MAGSINQSKELKSWVMEQINSNLVVVFSKTYCPYCHKAKDALTEAGLQSYTTYELDKREDGEIIMDILRDLTGERTVPRVFIDGKCVGGGTETAQLQQDGKLKSILKKCGAL